LSGTLYLVATPIGNLGDISQRALDTLRNADFIAAEDTRVTSKLLARFEIKKPMVSYYEHNRLYSGEKILERLLGGEACALVTDAGTPGISDPGEDLVRLCAENGVAAIAIPGACAAVTALSVSGLPAGRFAFEGFLSTSQKSRRARLDELKGERRAMVFYEAPHKLIKTLEDLLNTFGDRRVTLCRELTKLYEEILRLTLSQALAHFRDTPPRGEFVLVVEGAPETSEPKLSKERAILLTLEYMGSGLSRRDSAKRAAFESGFGKNELYEWSLEA
jgi:16S rRNA (cytidine1402-2'-O)-methyltransferase